MADKFKRCLIHLINTFVKLFKQQKNDNDLVHDRILHVVDDLKELLINSKMTNAARPQRLFP